MENLPEIAQLTLNGVPVIVAVLISVQALKGAGLVTDDVSARRANIISGLVFGAVWFARQVVPMAVANIIDLAYVAYIGSLGAGLAYEGLKALAARFWPSA